MIARLAREERGAIALMAVFMAVFLVAVVAYVQGIGAAVLHREQMQDAADAAAFSSAALHARGMNVLALLNMLMAALLAILVALKLIEVITGIAIVAISVIAFFLPGAAAAIPPLGELRQGVLEAHDSLSPGVHTALEAMHVAATGVRTLVPAVSQVSAVGGALAEPGSPAQLAFAVPMRATLPTQDGSFAEICSEAGEYVGDLTKWVLGKVALPDEIADVVGDATRDLVRTRGEWFCGEGGAQPPKTKVKHRYTYPQLPERVRCNAIHPDASGYEADEHALLCDAAERAELDSQPDEQGSCAGPSVTATDTLDCDDASHPYHVRAWLAREDCAPEADEGRRRKLRAFEYQERHFTRRYRFEEGRWRVDSSEAEERDGETLRHVSGKALRPCGHPRAPIASPWNDGRSSASHRQQPVCSDAEPPPLPGREGEQRALLHHEVTHVFGCTRTVTSEHEVSASEGGRPADAEREVPQRLAEGVELGGEALQMRAGVLGELPSDRPRRLVELSTWKAEPHADGSVPAAPELGRIALAQAEYYYDGPEHAARESFMWSMRWRARLRRFTWPDAGGDASVDPVDAGAFSPTAVEVSLDAACALAAATAGVSEAESPCAELRERASELAH